MRLALRISDYNIKRTSFNAKGAIFFIGSLFVVAVVYFWMLFLKKIPERYRLYRLILVYSLAYTIGSYRQYDVLLRNVKLIVFLAIPFITIFLNKFINFNNEKICVFAENNGDVDCNIIISMLLIALVVFSFVFYTLFSYIPMVEGFA